MELGDVALKRAIARNYDERATFATPTQSMPNRWQVLQENQGLLVTAERVWSPFYVDDMIQTVDDPQVTTSQSNGSIDDSFGYAGNGTAYSSTTDTGYSLSYAHPSAQLLSDGDTLVIALFQGTGSTTVPELMWFTPDGLVDTAYGGGTGVVKETSWTNWNKITGMVIQSNGMIDVTVTNGSGMEIAQFNADGSPNTSWGSGGLLPVSYGGSALPTAVGLALASDGDILIAAYTQYAGGTTCYVVAINPSTGSLDGSFNCTGIASVNVSTAVYVSG